MTVHLAIDGINLRRVTCVRPRRSLNLADALVRGETNGVAGLLAITMAGPNPGTGRMLTRC